MKKDNRGGKREGSGRKPIYGEPTVKKYFRIPGSKVKEITNKIKEILKEYKL